MENCKRIFFWKALLQESYYFQKKNNDLNLTVNKLETKLLQQSLNYSNTTFLLTWWADQNWPHMVFFILLSASIKSAALSNFSLASFHWQSKEYTFVFNISGHQCYRPSHVQYFRVEPHLKIFLNCSQNIFSLIYAI